MLKWIELLKPVDDHKAGAFLEVEEPTARAYCDAGLARDGGKGPDVVILERAIAGFRDELKGFVTSTAATLQEATQNLQTKKPNLAGGADPEGWSGTESEADKSRSLGDAVKQIVYALGCPDQDARRESHERLTKVYKFTRNMGEGSGATGGYLTSPTFEQTILQVEAEDAVMKPGATEVPLGSREVTWPALNQYFAPSPGQSAMYAGVNVYYKGEAKQRQETDASLAQVKLVAQDLTALTEFSRDLMADAPALSGMLPTLIGGAIGFREDYEFLLGTGQGRPLGIVNAPARITIARTTALTVTWADVSAMKSRLYSRGRGRAVFLAHPYMEQVLMTMTDAAGHLIYVPYFNGEVGPAGTNPPPRLAGIPVLFTEKLPAPGNEGDLILTDRKAYLAGTRSGLEIALSEHFLFDSDQIALRAKIRHDGQPWMKKPLILADGAGTNQVSAIVTLSTKLS